MVVRTFVVNLKRSIKRRTHIEKVFRKIKLPFEFIEGIDGQNLNDEEINRVYDENRAKKVFGRKLFKPEIGCYLSHVKIYEKIVNESIPISLILEDDIVINKNLQLVLDLFHKFPKDWELVLLGHHHSHPNSTKCSYWQTFRLNKTYTLKRPIEPAYGAYGYLITLKGAKKMISFTPKVYQAIDFFTGSDKYCNLYVINKPVVDLDGELNFNNSSMEVRENYFNRVNKQTNKPSKLLFHIKYQIKTFLKKIKPLRKYRNHRPEILI